MSSVLLGKLLIGGTGTLLAAASTVIGLNWDKIIGNVEWVVYVKVGSAISDASSTALPKDGTKGYKCQFEALLDGQISNEEFHCSIQKIVFVKNQWDFSVPLASTATDLSAAELKTEHNVLQISFKSNSYDWKTHESKKIEIISKHADDKNKKFSTTTLFAVSGDKQFINPTDFIGQADKASTSGDKLSDYKCSWEDKESSNAKDCKVYVFADDSQDSDKEHTELTFKKDTTETKEIKQHHYYRIVWTPTTEAKDNTNIIFAKATKSSGDTSTVATIKFEKVKTSFLVGENIVVIKDKQSY